MKQGLTYRAWMLQALISLFMGLLLSYLAWVSPGTKGGMDSYEHYLIARYSWKYPNLFLDQWGKPLYTIFASVFAQFGFMGVELFNVALLILSAWIMWFCARALNFKYPVMVFSAVIFSPIFLDNTISGLTEPFNAAMLAMVLLFLAQKKENAAALLAGFLPYARSEGYVILAVIGVYFLFYQRNFKASLLLFVGSLVFNLLGWWLDHPPGEAGDPFWVISHNPYLNFELSGRNICGNGPLLHYVKISNYIFGRILLVLIGLGVFWLPIRFVKAIRERSDQRNKLEIIMFFALGIFALYFGVHSIIWKLGMMGSCGLQRVMVVIIPCTALLAGWMFEELIQNIPEKAARIKNGVIILVFIGIAAEPFNYAKGKYPLTISAEQTLYTEFATWYKSQDFSDRTVYFFYPYLHVLLDIDPYDSKRFIKLWSFDESWAPHGSIVIWDGHFGPNECNIQLGHLQNNPKFRHIRSFVPTPPFKTLNNYDFEIHVFEWLGNE